MKILPNYLIQYMPELEEAIEELRLSVLDHAYDLLKRLDIDELTTDEIRQKLDLYGISVDNMSTDWLPNGRFYRLYPYIKHHRSRKNTIQAIAKSGGQFEGLWSDTFNNKPEFEFKSIQVLRHYDILSDADGYFFVSGNTKKTASGKVKSSVAQALTTDILINQALPAGYTYLYVPWPRPVYPGDVNYFYNVHMLEHDRLHYADDCTHKWFCINEADQIYYCPENSIENQYCKITSDGAKYRVVEDGKLTDIYRNSFFISSDESTDVPYFNVDDISADVPASTRYDWKNGIGTPYRTPYWFDYHYMGKMYKTEPNTEDEHNIYYGTWPILEIGNYYDEDDDISDPEDAVTYVLNDGCKELADPHSAFPTSCYLKLRQKTTEPNREQKFSFGSPTLTIFSVSDDRFDLFVKFLCETLHLNVDTTTKLFKESTLEFTYEKTDNQQNKITITDGEYSGYVSIKLKIQYTLNEETITEIVEFENGIWISESTDNIENIIVYSPVKFVTNVNILEAFENNLAYFDNTVIAYNQEKDVIIDHATYDKQSKTVDLNLTDDERKALGVDSTYSNIFDELEFSSSAWIIKQDTENVYYGEKSFEIWKDYGFDSIRPRYYDGCNYKIDYSHLDSIDAHDCLEPDHIALNERDDQGNLLSVGPYRWDLLHSGSVFHISERLGHFKNYKPFWCENTPWSAMGQSLLGEDVSNHSLYHWMNLKQSENRPAISELNGNKVVSDYYDSESILKDNEPSVSEVTFTSCDRPTRGRLDPLYIGYLSDNVPDQEENTVFDGSIHVYTFDDDPDNLNITSSAIEYDPEYYYTVINLNYNTNDGQDYKVNHIDDGFYSNEDIFAQPMGDPSSKELLIDFVANNNHHFEQTDSGEKAAYNYITFKKSKTHKLWFSGDHKNVQLTNTNALYNMRGTTNIYKYSSNDVNITYTVLGIYTEDGVKLDATCNMNCTIESRNGVRKYVVSYSGLTESNISAAYILFTVKVVPGSVEVAEIVGIDANLYYNTALRSAIIAKLPPAEYTNT